MAPECLPSLLPMPQQCRHHICVPAEPSEACQTTCLLRPSEWLGSRCKGRVLTDLTGEGQQIHKRSLCRELIDRCCPQQHTMHAQNSMHQQAHGAWASRAHPARPHRPLSSLQQQGSRQVRGQAACAAPARERSGTPAAPHNGDMSAPAPLSQAERDDMEAAARAMADSLEAVCAGLSEETPLNTAALNSIMEGLDVEAGSPDSPAAAAAPKKVSKRAPKRHQGPRPRAAEIPFQDLPKVAIVGRPNVGKSALFNRLTGSPLAIVYDYPGVTRDRLYTRAFWGQTEFVMVDTGGLMSDALKLSAEQVPAAVKAISAAGLPAAIERQAAAGVAEAQVLILVVDGQSGLTAADEEVVSWLRRSHPKKPVILAVNKCENSAKADIQAAEFWGLGLHPIPLSAISGTGTGELMERLMAKLPPPRSAEVEQEGPEPLAVAIVGRPNVGKSSILNALVGKERSIVSSVSGTTRDAIDTEITTTDGQRFTLIDTAGIRKRVAVAASTDGAETLSVNRALTAIRRADVVALVVDAPECTTTGHFVATQQDFRLAELIAGEGRACVIVVNKWDAIPEKTSTTLDDVKKDVLSCLRPLQWAQVIFTSATTGQRLQKILSAVTDAGAEHRHRLSTATLNMVLQETVAWRSPPSSPNGKRGRIYYVTQASTRPPTFVFFVNDAKLFTDDYKRYCEKQLRQNVGFPGTPLRIFWRGKPPRAPEN